MHQNELKSLKASFSEEIEELQSLLSEAYSNMERLNAMLHFKNKEHTHKHSVKVAQKFVYLSRINQLKTKASTKDKEYKNYGETINYLAQGKFINFVKLI
jgi:hypothetical protein